MISVTFFWEIKSENIKSFLKNFMPSVTRPANQPGEFLVDYEEKVFPDVKAEPCLLYTSDAADDS